MLLCQMPDDFTCQRETPWAESVAPENIYTHPIGRLMEIPRGRRVSKANFLNESMTLKGNFQRGGGFNLKNLPWERYGYFLE